MQADTKPVAQRTLRELFCEACRCAPEAFEEKAFWMTQRRHTAWIVRILRALKPSMYEPDLKLLQAVGGAASQREVRTEMEFCRHNNPVTGFFCKSLKLRVSGQQVIYLAGRLFAQEGARRARAAKQSPGAPPPGSPRS